MFATAERTHPEASDGGNDHHLLVRGEPGISVPNGITDVPGLPDRPGFRRA
ncbi:hypothetical protein [Streptomyces mobaraensis]|uniref:hypothetical protein n=1 Tax=Streptomyces mobaraensis TaxID=35621 RepID=UPI0012ACF3E2|nr:hypothetical protein [Streptomyces mobaraensis]